ncbi:MAG: hypothetical protein R3B72_27255 [Polyangiaceae bacterium]
MMRPTLLLCLIFLVACGSDQTTEPPAPKPVEGTLSLELRDQLTITLTPPESTKTTITLAPSATYGLLAAGETTVEGRVAPLPEANATLYTAKLDVPAQSGGPCGDEPISVALSLHRQGLHRQGQNTTVIGGLSAYCGAGRWHGVPVRVLRLAGELPVF